MSSILRVLRALTGTVLALALIAGSTSTAAAQSAAEDSPDAPLVGYTTRDERLPNTGEWTDPVVLFDLDPALLAPPPEFDLATLHDSTIFASGIDQVAVENDDLDIYVERHLRVLQATATLDRDLNTAALGISIRRPRIDRLNTAIATEHQEEARLAEEIVILQAAIAEFAVRAFIAEDELDTALNVPQTGLSETRVVTDEVRDDQLQQIVDRKTELARRQARRADLENDLRLLRSELRLLRSERNVLLEHRRASDDLLAQTAATYQLALHDRLPKFVDGIDIPLVALNAYVIAERKLAIEQPRCQIQWWMLAGIGKIESFHGHFGDSTLNINGHTTDLIRGPALDGRILEGEEFLVDGVELPEPTDRTEAIEIAVPAPAVEGADASAASATSADSTANGTVSTSAPAPVPVIKRLALIKDSDGGRLDQDTTYDRAVGPMQFIPQTWSRYEADGNGDDISDPQNVYDAALASAQYLCTASTMATIEGQQQAYFAYNHDEEYTANVAAAGDYYRRQVEIPDEPFGSTTPLGIGDPELQSISGKASNDVKTFDDGELLDW